MFLVFCGGRAMQACNYLSLIEMNDHQERFCDIVKSVGIIAGGVLFLGGSALFLPGQKANLGTWLFLWGCALYAIIRVHDTGILVIRGGRCLDLTVVLLYLIGLLVFMAGSVFLLEQVALFDVGGVLFILGSFFFVLGSVVNVFQAFEMSRSKSSSTFLLSVLTAIVFCIGSSLFLCSRLSYLLLLALDPEADIVQLTRSLSIQCIAGSAFFVVGGILNCIRVVQTDEISKPRQCEAEEAQSSATLSSSAGAPQQTFGDIEDRPVRDLLDEIYVPSIKRSKHRPKARERDRFAPWLFPMSSQVPVSFSHKPNRSLASNPSEEPSTSGAS